MKGLVFLLITSVVFASKIDFVEVSDGATRTMPTNSNLILSYHDSIKDAKKSVVNISTTKTHKQNTQIQEMFNHPFFRDFFGGQGVIPDEEYKTSSLGSGVIISSDGYIVTNNHVVEGATQIVVSLIDNSKEYQAKVVGLDPKSDLAVIKIEESGLSAIKFANSIELLEGDVVFAIGNPFGVGGSISKGIISALNKSGIGLNRYEDFIQTDASINPGNSGGALVDSRGALVGINTAILSRSGGNNGIGFAIPSNMVKTISKALIETGKIERGYLGVSIGDLTSDLKEVYTNKEGALILGVEEDGPAHKANIKRLDLIIQINNSPIKNANDLKNTIGAILPNEKVKIKLERDNVIKTYDVTLTNMDKQTTPDTIKSDSRIKGLTLDTLTDEHRYRFRINKSVDGVLVLDVENESDAQKFGFKRGDVIVQVEQSVIKDINQLNDALKSSKKAMIRVLVSRGGYISPILIK